MKNDIQIFNHPEFGVVRIAVEDGKVWFCLNDVCKSLEIANPRNIKSRMPDRGVRSMDTPIKNQFGTTVMQQMTYINEPNLYRCIFQSRKSEAVQYQDWVFDEVLPQIHYTGGYIPVQKDDDDATLMAKALTIAQRTIENKDRLLEMQRPVVEYCEEVLKSEDCVTTTQVAKQFGMSAKALNKKLKDLGIEFWQSGQWHLYSKYAKMGFAQSRTNPYYDNYGNVKTSVIMVWTELGKRFVSELIRKDYDLEATEKLFDIR